jgi:hypothetical protein
MRRILVIVTFLAFLPPALAGINPATKPATRPADLVPLEVKLPQRSYDGTWMQFGEWRRARPEAEDCTEKLVPFLVPPGTRNLALHRPVTSSDNKPSIGRLDQITDGNNEGLESNLVELGPRPQWVQIDLGQSARLFAILVWHNTGQPNLHMGVIVQLSDDPAFEKGVRTIFNNDRDNLCGLGRGADREYFEAIGTKVIDAKGIASR